MIYQAFTLLILLNFCHWIADYTWLSTDEMLSAKKFGEPLFPILKHALVHAVLTFAVVFFLFSDKSVVAALIMLITHFLIDLSKGKMNKWFKVLQSPSNKLHWVVFGGDQFLHQVVIITIVYITLAQ